MNIPTLLILLVILALAALAVWRMRKKGSGCGCGSQGCASCPGCPPPAEDNRGHGA